MNNTLNQSQQCIVVKVGMLKVCPSCSLPNTTLTWHETAQGFVCLGCYYGRREEQTRIEQQWLKQHKINILNLKKI